MKKIFRFLGIVLLVAAVSAGTTLAVLKYSTPQFQIISSFRFLWNPSRL